LVTNLPTSTRRLLWKPLASSQITQAEIEVSQRCALRQHSCKALCPCPSDLIGCQIEASAAHCASTCKALCPCPSDLTVSVPQDHRAIQAPRGFPVQTEHQVLSFLSYSIYTIQEPGSTNKKPCTLGHNGASGANGAPGPEGPRGVGMSPLLQVQPEATAYCLKTSRHESFPPSPS